MPRTNLQARGAVHYQHQNPLDNQKKYKYHKYIHQYQNDKKSQKKKVKKKQSTVNAYIDINDDRF